jgi:hypothetical protein
MAQRLRGTGRVKRILRGLPDAVQKQLVSVLESGGRGLQSAMRARAPKLTGAVRQGITYKVLPKSLRLRVGLLGTPRGRAKLFYGRIQDLGRRGQVVFVQRRRRVEAPIGGGATARILRTSRGRKVKADIVAAYAMRVRPMAPKRFITGRFPDLRAAIGNALRGIWGRALGSIARGGDE